MKGYRNRRISAFNIIFLNNRLFFQSIVWKRLHTDDTLNCNVCRWADDYDIFNDMMFC